EAIDDGGAAGERRDSARPIDARRCEQDRPERVEFERTRELSLAHRAERAREPAAGARKPRDAAERAQHDAAVVERMPDDAEGENRRQRCERDEVAARYRRTPSASHSLFSSDCIIAKLTIARPKSPSTTDI